MKTFAKKPLLLALTVAALGTTLPAHADEAELRARLDRLSAELDALKSEVKTLRSQNEALAAQQEATMSSTPVAANQNATATGGTTLGQVAQAAAQATLWGYGEINYNRPRNNASETRMDLRRAVVGVGYRFDENTRFMSEFEIEHAVASADDSGEVEVEQFYIDHKLSDAANLKAGLFLIPAGFLNESHEPTNYYGVERNFVETAIIPSTWREGGAAVYGTTDGGLAWDIGLTTGPSLGNWDPASTEGRESPLGSIHQELQMARARDLSTYLALNYRGMPGFTAGGSVFTGKIGQGDAAVKAAADARATLWELHSRWTPGNWDLAAIYAKGRITDTADLNLQFAGFPTPVPEAFYGWYTQAAYHLWQRGSYRLTPFVRFERFTTGSSYATMPPGLTIPTVPLETVATYGVNFYLNPHVVLKADYQHFEKDTASTRYDLGLGVAF